MPSQQNKVASLFLAFFILVDRLIGTCDDNNVAHYAFASSKMVFKGRRGGTARDSPKSMQKGLWCISTLCGLSLIGNLNLSEIWQLYVQMGTKNNVL